MNAIRGFGFRLAGSGAALPRTAVPSSEIDARIGQAPGWTEAHFGIANRYWARDGETSSSLGAAAGSAALAAANWEPGDLDVILSACGVMEQPIPGNAPLIQRRLGIGSSGITAFDINATCLSFLVALDTLLTGMAVGKWRRGLIVSVDIASAALDFGSPEASVIFGDGAAAVAIEADGLSRLLACRLATFGDGAELCRLESGGTRMRPTEDLDVFLEAAKFRMDGSALFAATAKRFPRFLRDLLAESDVAADELGTIVPHQASAAAIEHLKRAVPGGHAKTIDIFRDHGNQIAAGMPHALHVAHGREQLAPGSHSLLIGTSAGVSLGGAVIRW
ncbi:MULTISPECIES: 3-oxoacyl-[acyl-carrier-protein] synthase III C-terminal domain-containing protein [unclassified Sphingomonas]|jgi:3-oxoacyl-[acyl-carrier-protein] synthase III|uniref:3-oxoacyl-[acyl-carrier-protein] synthase III C-terminal domain-containing protein n=1 Tax=unclassified Sphingomonas TaxID=196159 RepID=UPI0010F6D864|nr:MULTISPECIES: 3-oxoacyl-[acyl-carrier-protein] synthase III C-terminal domain-containing protein [unclassified Sphingomonas]